MSNTTRSPIPVPGVGGLSTAPGPAPGGAPAVAGNRPDKILLAFLEQQYRAGMALAARSDVLKLNPIGAALPPQHYLAEFTCRSAARSRTGDILIARRRHVVSLFYPDDYLRRADQAQVISWLEPLNIHSPHIAPPYICTGRISSASNLVDHLYQIYEIITYFRVTPREDDAVTPAACAWARNHRAEFPLDRTPLKRPAPPQGEPVNMRQ